VVRQAQRPEHWAACSDAKSRSASGLKQEI
jgi:hypothetical protein